MIINLLSRHSKAIAWSLYFLFCAEWLSAIPGPVAPLPLPARTYVLPFAPSPASKPAPAPATTKHAYGGGPGQPEMQAFQSVNANNMVDLFTGDFSYNIPLMDVGGYPLNISYRSGISMDQEASWVGLGWNINPGTITRNLSGLPDDFSGKDSIKKINSIKENKTIGVTAGGSGDVEVAGLPINATLGASLGVFHNNYKGWGLENGINATINSAQGSKGGLTGGLGLSAENNSQDGLTLTPSLSLELSQRNADDNASLTNSFSVALPYNSRSGLKGLQLSIGQRLTRTDLDNQSGNNSTSTSSSTFTSTISFASTAYTPTITMPLTTRQYSFTAKLGLAQYTFHPSVYLSGYISKQSIDPSDTLLALPAYGYLHYQDGAGNKSALLDFNREKELVYRENPVMPHIAVPLYTYDAFSITGEGTGGMFRAYRGDVGYIYDHLIRTKDFSDKASVDLGYSNLVHGGLDLNFTRAFTQNSAWTDQNSLGRVMGFKKDSGLFQAAYFRNPGEKSINSKKFYDGLGGDDVVTAKLYQAGTSSSVIQATNYLTLYRGKRPIADSLMTPQKAFKQERDKRTQVISYLNAQEADVAGLSKYIENYTPNVFTLATCSPAKENDEGDAIGLVGEYFTNKFLTGAPAYVKLYDTIGFKWDRNPPATPVQNFPSDFFSIRWTGRLKAPVTGRYVFHTTPDDGVRFWLNDSLLIQNYLPQTLGKDTVYLVAGEMYPLKMEYYENGGNAKIDLQWSYPGQSTYVNVPRHYLYPPAVDTFDVNGYLV
ncbi:MAG TPA: PA14 domain-containing protein, partial [Puia sp.]|nr:PA14 domain-containing protein [Puia sp.]